MASLNPVIIVIGSGLAGLSAASQFLSHHLSIQVHLLERNTRPGGNSIKASSGINGAPTPYQRVPDTAFYEDTLHSVGSVLATSTLQREKLVATLTNKSSSAIDWLVEKKGVDLSVVAQLGGHSIPRTHRGSGKTPPGAAIITTLLDSLKEDSRFILETECIVTKVLCSHGVVSGVEYTQGGDLKSLSGLVLVASGGFAGDIVSLAKYRPDLANIPSTNDPRPGSQLLLTSIGAQLRDMSLVQIHPTAFVDPASPLASSKFLAAELLRGEGGILMFNGERFVNELESRKAVTEAIMALPAEDENPHQWHIQLVLDQATYRKAAAHVDFYLWKALMRMTTVGELVERFPNTAMSTLQQYTEIVAGRGIDPFGRQTFGSWDMGEITVDTIIYVGRVTPAVHFTMGGIVINERSEVLDDEGKTIKGVWAAGEVTGGIHGENRLGGNSLLECVVFGRIAGDEIAKALRDKGEE